MFKKLFSKDLKGELNKLNSSYNGLIQVLDRMNQENSGMQSREDLEMFPFLVWVYLNELIKIRRKGNRFVTYLSFESLLLKGGKFSKHFHPDLIESSEVKKGKVIDHITSIIYTENDIMHFHYGQIHDIEALEDSELNVIFK